MTKLLLAIRKMIIAFTLLLLLFVAGIKVFFPYISHYQSWFEQVASRSIQQPVTIGSMTAEWNGLWPTVNLTQVSIYDKAHQTKLIEAQQLQFTIDIFASLLNQRLIPKRLHLSGAKLVIQQLPDNILAINGIHIATGNANTKKDPLSAVLQWLNQQGEIGLNHVDITWQGLDGTNLAIGNLQLLLIASRHHLQLNARNIHADTPHFSQSLIFNQLKFNAAWFLTLEGWKIALKDLLLTNPDIQLKGQRLGIQFYAQKNHSPMIDLLLNFAATNVAKINAYIPKNILSKGLESWLATALVKGEANGQIAVHGPLNKFPYAHNEGRLHAVIKTKNLELNYLHDWPELTQVHGNFVFDNNSLKIAVSDGQLLGIQTKTIQAEIADLHNPTLKLHWQSNAKYNDLVQAIVASPLNKILGGILSYFNYTGPTELKIAAQIPIHEPKKLQIDGRLQFKPHGILQIPDYHIALQSVQGSLQFSQNSVNATDLHAQWLKQPMAITIATNNKIVHNPEFTVNIAGILPIAEVLPLYNIILPAKTIAGTTHYQAQLHFAKDIHEQKYTQFKFNSDLSGISINLPQPFKKEANEAIATQVNLTASANDLTILAHYNNKLSAAIALQKNNQQNWALNSGDIEFGSAAAKITGMPGLAVNGHIDSLNITELVQYLTPYLQSKKTTEKTAEKTTEHKSSFDLASIKFRPSRLSIDQVQALGMLVSHLLLTSRQNAYSWIIELNSTEIAGKIIIPFVLDHKRIQAYFSRLYLNPIAQQTTVNTNTQSILPKADASINPGSIPSLVIIIENLHYKQRNLGNICLITARDNNAMQIRSFTVSFPFFRLLSSGRWERVGGQENTLLTGQITTTNMGALLKDWNITQKLKDADGSADFILDWDAPPYHPDAKTLDGKFSFKFEDGQILNVVNNKAEIGLGQILNILSIQTLKNILLKPFHLLKPTDGLPFDILRGEFTVKSGNAVTKNTFLRGDLMKMKMTGRIGLAAKDFDLLMDITPYLTGSLTGASVFVAGPAIGAVVWVANKFIGGILNSFFKVEYQVTGPWSDPKFQKL